MKYKDYYQILGVQRSAGEDDIKKAYRKLARKYHPDVSKDKDAEERFKEIAEAYATLKDTEKRAAYDNLGRYQPGEDFRPPPDWEGFAGMHGMGGAGGNANAGMGGASFHFEDFADLSELFEQFGLGGAGGRKRGRRGPAQGVHGTHGDGGFAMPGQDYEAKVNITLEDAARGTQVQFALPGGESVTVRIPRGAVAGQRLRVRGKGGPGVGNGPAGDLYLEIAFEPHKLYRVEGRDLYIDLPLSPSEAVLGAQVELPTLEGKVALKVKPGAASGQKLRLSGKGLPGAGSAGQAGDLYAVIQIVVPVAPGEREKKLYEELAQASGFDPRARFKATAAA
jgi:curved DNA-binding protein